METRVKDIDTGGLKPKVDKKEIEAIKSIKANIVKQQQIIKK